MLERAVSGAPEGLWLRADAQDGGRGRLGRQWVSPSGNLYASTIIRIGNSDPAPSDLAFLAGVSVHAALRKIGPDIPFMLKWPNDILVDGAKICGMLLERRDDAIIVGIGVNLASHPENLDRAACSLTALGITPPSPQEAVEMIAQEFTVWLERWRMAGLPAILREWRQHGHAVGTALTANLPDGQQYTGEFMDLSDDGALKLRLADGTIRAIHAGDIFIL